MEWRADLGIGTASTLLALLAIAVAVGLTWLQHRELRRRPEATDEFDRRYFARQDRRRSRGIIVLGLIGLAIGIGGNIDIRAGRAERLAFLVTWGGVFLLLLQLLALALVDLWSTRRYAARQSRRLADERRRLLEAEIAERRRLKRDHED